MKRLIFLVCVISFVKVNGDSVEKKEEEILPNFLHPYQDVINKNGIGRKGPRECEKRYKAIQPLLDKFKRPITVLDLGASEGYFSFRIAKEYDSVCVMVEDGYVETPGNTGNALRQLCKINDYPNIILLQKRISVSELKKLSESEHFDIVLALNFIHHQLEDWKGCLETVLKLGDHVIIEQPSDARPYVLDAVRKLPNKTLLGTFSRCSNIGIGEMYHFYSPKKSLKRTSIWNQEHHTNYQIFSNFEKKLFIKKINNRAIITEWKPGINLVTFKYFNGVYPSSEDYIKSFKSKNWKEHLDLSQVNIIIQGKEVTLIDSEIKDSPHSKIPAKTRYEWILESLKLNSESFNKFLMDGIEPFIKIHSDT